MREESPLLLPHLSLMSCCELDGREPSCGQGVLIVLELGPLVQLLRDVHIPVHHQLGIKPCASRLATRLPGKRWAPWLKGQLKKAGSMISEGVPLRAWAVAKRKRFGLNFARLSVHLSSTL